MSALDDTYITLPSHPDEHRETDWLNLALDTSHSGVWEWIPETDTHIWSRAVWRLFGLEPGKPDFQRWAERVHPDDWAPMIEMVRQAVASAAPFHAEYRIFLENGSQSWLFVRGMPVPGQPLRYLGIVTDITDKKQIELGLKNSEQLLRLLADSSPSGIWRTDATGANTYVSARWSEITGIPPEMALGRGWSDGVHPEDREKVFTGWLETAPCAKDGYRSEFRFVRPNGEVVSVLCLAKPLQVDGELETGWVGTITDVTELIAARELEHEYSHRLECEVTQRTAELDEARWLYRMVADFTHDWEIWIDVDGSYRYCSPSCERVTGHTAAEFVERPELLFDLVHPDDVPAVREHFSRHDHRAGTEEIVFRITHPELGERWLEHLCTPVVGENGQPMGRRASTRDVTERQRLAAEREEARRAAEELARVKSEFLANMSHEIRTPLNGVLGLAQIGYRDSAGRGKAQETFARILDSGKLLLGVINDILDFSKIEAGKLAIESAVYSPRRIVEEAVAVVEERAGVKGLSISTTLNAALPRTCQGDPARLSQILLNLLSNAIKFTDRGGVGVKAGRDGEWLVFEVTDSGIGMSEAQVGKLFRPFEQADTSTTRKYGGTGLGLSISQRLAQLMGGEIRAESEAGKGSRFELRLPYQAARELVEDGVPAAPAKRAAERLAGMKILAAEDNEVNRMVLEDILLREGAQVRLVENGRQAVEAVEAAPRGYDLVLMDVQMPEMDGRTATRRILEINPQLPVIGQTAHALAEERQACLDAGMVATVLKPLQIEILVSTLLEKRRVNSRATPSSRHEYPGKDAGNAVIDWTELESEFAGRTEFLKQLVQVAIVSQKDASARLRLAAEQGNLTVLADIAHTLKGFALNMRAPQVRDLATRVSHNAAANIPQTIEQARELANAVETLLDVMRHRYDS